MRRTIVLALFFTVGGALTQARAQCPPLPYQLTNGQTADATQVMTDFSALAGCINTLDPAGATNSIQYNAGGGVFGGIPLTNGQVIVGSTGSAPQATGLTAGPGISITNGPGSVTVSTAGGNATLSPFYDPLALPLTRPSASNFTVNNSTGNTGSISDMVSRGVAFTIPSGSNFVTAMEQPIPSSSSFTATALVYPVGYLAGNWFWGIGIKDSGGKYVGFGFRNLTPVSYFTFASVNSVVGVNTTTGIVNAQNPVWVKVQLTGGNFVFSFSFDGENFNPGWTVSATDFLGATLSTIGFICENNATGKNIILDILSWTATSP